MHSVRGILRTAVRIRELRLRNASLRRRTPHLQQRRTLLCHGMRSLRWLRPKVGVRSYMKLATSDSISKQSKLAKRSSRKLGIPSYITPRDLGKKIRVRAVLFPKVAQQALPWWPKHTRRELRAYGFGCFDDIVLSFEEAKAIAEARQFSVVRADFDSSDLDPRLPEGPGWRRWAEHEFEKGNFRMVEAETEPESESKERRGFDGLAEDATPSAPKGQEKAPKTVVQLHGEVPRPMLVAVLGHVNHGKTTLLDGLRGVFEPSNPEHDQNIQALLAAIRDSKRGFGRRERRKARGAAQRAQLRKDAGMDILRSLRPDVSVSSMEAGRITQENYVFSMAVESDPSDSKQADLTSEDDFQVLGVTPLLDPAYLHDSADVVGDHPIAEKVPTVRRGFTFLDTPGHAVLSELRWIGSRFCDCALLVVDVRSHGKESQTLEAVQLALEINSPVVVALTHTDVASAEDSIATVNTLRELGLQLPKPSGAGKLSWNEFRSANKGKGMNRKQMSEAYKAQSGSQMQLGSAEWQKHTVVALSAVNNVNVFPRAPRSDGESESTMGTPSLLTRLCQTYDHLRTDSNIMKPSLGLVLESFKEQGGRGIVARVVGYFGTVQKGDWFVCGHYYGRIKNLKVGLQLPTLQNQSRPREGLFRNMEPVDMVPPGVAFEVSGFAAGSDIPLACEDFIVCSEERAKEISQQRLAENLYFAQPNGVYPGRGKIPSRDPSMTAEQPVQTNAESEIDWLRQSTPLPAFEELADSHVYVPEGGYTSPFTSALDEVEAAEQMEVMERKQPTQSPQTMAMLDLADSESDAEEESAANVEASVDDRVRQLGFMRRDVGETSDYVWTEEDQQDLDEALMQSVRGRHGETNDGFINPFNPMGLAPDDSHGASQWIDSSMTEAEVPSTTTEPDMRRRGVSWTPRDQPEFISTDDVGSVSASDSDDSLLYEEEQDEPEEVLEVPSITGRVLRRSVMLPADMFHNMGIADEALAENDEYDDHIVTNGELAAIDDPQSLEQLMMDGEDSLFSIDELGSAGGLGHDADQSQYRKALQQAGYRIDDRTPNLNEEEGPRRAGQQTTDELAASIAERRVHPSTAVRSLPLWDELRGSKSSQGTDEDPDASSVSREVRRMHEMMQEHFKEMDKELVHEQLRSAEPVYGLRPAITKRIRQYLHTPESDDPDYEPLLHEIHVKSEVMRRLQDPESAQELSKGRISLKQLVRAVDDGSVSDSEDEAAADIYGSDSDEESFIDLATRGSQHKAEWRQRRQDSLNELMQQSTRMRQWTRMDTPALQKAAEDGKLEDIMPPMDAYDVFLNPASDLYSSSVSRTLDAAGNSLESLLEEISGTAGLPETQSADVYTEVQNNDDAASEGKTQREHLLQQVDSSLLSEKEQSQWLWDLTRTHAHIDAEVDPDHPVSNSQMEMQEVASTEQFASLWSVMSDVPLDPEGKETDRERYALQVRAQYGGIYVPDRMKKSVAASTSGDRLWREPPSSLETTEQTGDFQRFIGINPRVMTDMVEDLDGDEQQVINVPVILKAKSTSVIAAMSDNLEDLVECPPVLVWDRKTQQPRYMPVRFRVIRASVGALNLQDCLEAEHFRTPIFVLGEVGPMGTAVRQRVELDGDIRVWSYASFHRLLSDVLTMVGLRYSEFGEVSSLADAEE